MKIEQLQKEYELLINQVNPDLRTATRLYEIFRILVSEISKREQELQEE